MKENSLEFLISPLLLTKEQICLVLQASSMGVYLLL